MIEEKKKWRANLIKQVKEKVGLDKLEKMMELPD